jgi:hypothetical protein
LLLIYNTNSAHRTFVKDYYLAHRPMVGGANVLGIGSTANETATPLEFTNGIEIPYLGWLTENPTKHPQYVVLFLDIPSRVNTNGHVPGVYHGTGGGPSVSVRMHDLMPGCKPFVSHINMGGTNDCRAYIDKLRFIATNYSPDRVVLSASGGYGNDKWYLDDARYGYDAPLPSLANEAREGILSVLPTASIIYTNGADGLTNLALHLTNGVDVAGYLCWGGHSALGSQYATNGLVRWSGDSSWWIIQTIESFNGVRDNQNTWLGCFVQWFLPNAFGGTNHSNTPVGAVTHVDEPMFAGVSDSREYFGLWAKGKTFSSCAWNSRRTPNFQAVGDPLVRR